MGAQGLQRTIVRLVATVVLTPCLAAAAGAPSQQPSSPPPWRIRIDDPYTRDAAVQAVTGAARWLAAPQCQRLLSEFRGPDGRPLEERLAQLGITAPDYLGLITFLDDPASGRCRDGTLAFTVRGSRVVYLCGREFVRAWRRDGYEAQATIVHEMLHSLGLGERPPSPRHISERVMILCWP